MNDRIRELAAQAKEYADGYWDENTPAWFQFYNEKFAELVVKECAWACEQNSYLRLDGWQRAKQIREHFGVSGIGR